MEQAASKNIDRPISMILLVGMVLSMVLMLVGVLLLLLHPGSHFTTVLPLHKAIAGALRLDAQSWLSLGILVLILTPVARVVMAIGSFAWIRDWKYVLVSAVVLVAMLTGLLLGKG